ncbi:MAG: cell division FtsA domain-containing protein [Clostridium sp.]|nr:cell division FtsA domain-containing protein [Clostridium sp.]
MQQEIITAIDFGSYKFSASAAVKDADGEMQILNTVSCKSDGIEKGLISDTDKCREAIKNLLIELESKIKGNIDKVTIGISSRRLRLSEKTIDVEIFEDKITNEAIVKAINNCRNTAELSDEECIVDELINFYILDGKVVSGEVDNWKCDTAKINLALVICLKSEMEKYYKVFEYTKYKLTGIKSNILCGKQIFLSEGTNTSGDSVIVDVGAGKVDIAVFNKNSVPNFISSIPVGGNNISNDLAICGGFSFSEADNMKKMYSENYKSLYEDKAISDEIEVGAVKVSKELFYEVTNARIEEILNHINIELKKTGHIDRICSIILYGDGVSYFEDINKIANKIFKVKTKVITGVDLGIKNSENITSMALAKEVYDRLNLLGDNNIVSVKKNIEEQHQVNKTESLHYNEDENQILKKLKNFFNKIF